MAVTYSTATKTARMTAVGTTIGTSGKLKLFTAADSLLTTFTLAATAGTVSGCFTPGARRAKPTRSRFFSPRKCSWS